MAGGCLLFGIALQAADGCLKLLRLSTIAYIARYGTRVCYFTQIVHYNCLSCFTERLQLLLLTLRLGSSFELTQLLVN
jgi:hypothetical protein